MSIPNPIGTNIMYWSAQVHDAYPTTVPILSSSTGWRYWADRVAAAFQVYNVPRSEPFESFEAWAQAFYRSYDGEVN